MYNLILKFKEFMRGRNGTDELFIFMLALAFVMNVADVFVRSRIFHAVIILFYVLTFFRFFSKNLYARAKENAQFVIIKNKVINFFTSKKKENENPVFVTVKVKKKSKLRKKFELYKMRLRDKDHYYIKCPSCKAVIRLPKAKGTHTVECPRCGENFKTVSK